MICCAPSLEAVAIWPSLTTVKILPLTQSPMRLSEHPVGGTHKHLITKLPLFLGDKCGFNAAVRTQPHSWRTESAKSFMLKLRRMSGKSREDGEEAGVLDR